MKILPEEEILPNYYVLEKGIDLYFSEHKLAIKNQSKRTYS